MIEIRASIGAGCRICFRHWCRRAWIGKFLFLANLDGGCFLGGGGRFFWGDGGGCLLLVTLPPSPGLKKLFVPGQNI